MSRRYFSRCGSPYPGDPPVLALAGVDLRIDIGELVAIVGPSGSGKSTLLHVMGTLERPSRGTVHIAGANTSTMSDTQLSGLRERRSEIGLRRALGASRRHVAAQFLTEALLLSILGGAAGTIIGWAATVAYALSQHETVQIPALALYGGIAAATLIGAIAGLYPSMRAARLSPTEALRTV